MSEPMFLDAEALQAAAKVVGSTDVASVAITTYLNVLADRLEGKIEFRELGPMEFAKPEPPPDSEQPQLPGVHWEDYEDKPR